MHHGHDDVLGAGDEVHRTAHALDHFARDLPVGDVPVLGHLHGAEHRELDVLAANHGKRRGAVKVDRARHGRDGLLSGVDEVGVFVSFQREGAHSEDAVFGLKLHLHPIGNVVGHQGGDADAEVDVPTVSDFLRDALRDSVFIQHGSGV